MAQITVKSTKEEVIDAVAQNGLELEHASSELKNDRNVVLKAIAQDPSALKYASAELKNDRNVVLKAIAQDPSALKYASAELKNDRTLVLAAVEKSGWELKYASAELKNDRTLVLVALAQSGLWAFKYFSAEMKNDYFIKQMMSRSNKVAAAAATFLALEPLKAKIKQETNPERKKAVVTMVSAMEEAILGHYTDLNFNFQHALDQAIETARPLLEQQAGWKKAIDAVVNVIINFFSKTAEKRQANTGNTFSFFADPNPVRKEIEEVKATIISEQGFKPSTSHPRL